MELYCLDLEKKLLFAWVGAWSLSNISFSSITAYLVYWVIVTNTVVVFHKYSFEANIVQVPFGALQAVSCPTKLASFQQAVY